MFIFINPWSSYDKEDLDSISEVILYNSSTIIRWILLFVNIITIGLWTWVCHNEFLFSIAIPALCLLTFIILAFDIIYIVDLWKKKHLEN